MHEYNYLYSNCTNLFTIKANIFARKKNDLQAIHKIDLKNDIDAYFLLIDDPQLTTMCVLHIQKKITTNAITKTDIIISKQINLLHIFYTA